jgi:hypothetical protein
MKKTFLLSMLFSFAILCSCEKEGSPVEAQLAQRKAKLDSREQALDGREKALEQREQAVAEREKAVVNARVIHPRTQAPDAAQAEAERQKRIQQLPPELRALIPDRSQLDAIKARKDSGIQDRALQTERGTEDAQQSPTP